MTDTEVQMAAESDDEGWSEGEEPPEFRQAARDVIDEDAELLDALDE